jgi:hypothetical protein
LLRKLSQSLVAKGLPADEIEKLIADGEALAKATQSERQSRMPNYLNSVTALLDGLERNRRPERRTERFWT